MSEKEIFLKKDLVALLSKLNAQDKGQWGVLNAQQMVEHLSDSFRNYHGLSSKKILTPAEKLPSMKEFLMSEKPFKPNTYNIEMPQIPAPAKQPDIKSALEELRTEIKNFFDFFEKDNNRIMTNIFFGDLNFDQSVQLLYKHATHHLRQFGLVE